MGRLMIQANEKDISIRFRRCSDDPSSTVIRGHIRDLLILLKNQFPEETGGLTPIAFDPPSLICRDC